MLSELNTRSPGGRQGADDRTEPAPDGHTVAALGALLLLGGLLRLWGLRFGLPHDFSRPDEEKIVGAALGVLQGDLNPHMFLYPSLFIYANAAVYWVLFAIERVIGGTASRANFAASAAADPTLFHITARLLAAASGTATIAALYAGARELFSGRIALIAAATLAVVFLHVRDSHFGVTDVPVTLLVVLAWWSAARCFNRGLTQRRVIGMGILCGLAASTKYNAVLVVLPAVGAVVSELFKAGSLSLRKVATALFILSSCAALAFLLGTPYALLDRPSFLAEVDAQRLTAIGLRHGTVLDPAREVVGERGWIHHATFSLRYGVGMPLLVAGLIGATWVVWQGPLMAWLVLSFPLAFYVAMGSSQLVYARWVVPLVPFLCLMAAVGIDRLAVLLGAPMARLVGAPSSRTVTKILVVGLTVLVIAPSGARAVAFNQLVSRADTRVRAAEWIEGRV